jgi:hypothetical protein
VKRNLARGARCQAGVYVMEYRGLRKIRLQRLAARGIAFDDGRKPDGIAGSSAQFANDTEMIAAKSAGADDGEPDGFWRGGRHWDYWEPLLP